MQAAWYEQLDLAADVLQVGNTDSVEVESGMVRVRVVASGINPRDVKTRNGLRGPMDFPRIIPHTDGAGVIARTGQYNSSMAPTRPTHKVVDT